MPPTDPATGGRSDDAAERIRKADEALLSKTRTVARRITERVRRVLADTGTDHPALPPETDTGDEPPAK